MTPGSDCPSGKEQFATRAAAAERRDALRASGQAEVSLGVYHCLECWCWHVGHKGRRKEVRRRRDQRRGHQLARGGHR